LTTRCQETWLLLMKKEYFIKLISIQHNSLHFVQDICSLTYKNIGARNYGFRTANLVFRSMTYIKGHALFERLHNKQAQS
jgi:hypothetical protein